MCCVLRIDGCWDSECDSMKSIISDIAHWFIRINTHCVVAGWSLEVQYKLSAFIAASVAEMRSWPSATLALLAIFIAHLTSTTGIWILEDVALSNTERSVFDMSTLRAITGALHNIQQTDCTGTWRHWIPLWSNKSSGLTKTDSIRMQLVRIMSPEKSLQLNSTRPDPRWSWPFN